MRAKGYKKISTENNDINKIQEYIGAAVESLADSPILDGILLKNVSLISGTTAVFHKLNRPLQGYLIVRKRANADIWDSQDSNTAPSRTLILESSAAVTIDLYVF